MRHHPLLLGFMCLAVAGCQSTVGGYYSLVPTDPISQTVKLDSQTNSNFIVSKQKSSMVAASISREQSWADYGTAVAIKVKNTGKKPIEFGADSITVASAGQNLQVLGYEEIQVVIKQRQDAKEAAAMFAAVVGGVGAGLYAGSPNANPALASAITQQVVAATEVSANSVASSKVESDILSGESSTAFLTHLIVPPGRTVGGIVVVSGVPSQVEEMAITVENDTHLFSLALR